MQEVYYAVQYNYSVSDSGDPQFFETRCGVQEAVRNRGDLIIVQPPAKPAAQNIRRNRCTPQQTAHHEPSLAVPCIRVSICKRRDSLLYTYYAHSHGSSTRSASLEKHPVGPRWGVHMLTYTMVTPELLTSGILVSPLLPH